MSEVCAVDVSREMLALAEELNSDLQNVRWVHGDGHSLRPLEGHWNADRARTVDGAIGAFLLVRRAAWEAVGGFDARQWMYAEDLDLGWRAAAAGWRTRYEPAAIVRHHGAAAAYQPWGDERDVHWQRSTYAWMLRRRGSPVMRTFALLNTAGAGARVLLLTAPALVLGGSCRALWLVCAGGRGCN